MRIRKDFLPFGRPSFSAAEIRAVTRVLKGGWIGMGPEAIAFEGELARAVGVPEVVTVSSCTAALHMALLLHGVGPGDEVIVPSLTWCSTANAALYCGARPVFCDVDAKTLCLTPETVAARLTPKTKAVIAVHYGGRALDVHALRRALPSAVALVEDAAHAFGARYPGGAAVGSSGNIVCFSFYANKNLSTGEGGALALFDAALAERARSLRQHGLSADAWKRFSLPRQGFLYNPVHELGFKANYIDLLAALGRVQLRRQREFAKRRLAIAKIYVRALAQAAPAVEPLEGQLEAAHARHLFVLKTPPGADRDAIVLELRRRNIGASIHYGPLHQMPFYKKHDDVSLPRTEEAGRRILTLPISASMTLADASYVAAHAVEVLSRSVS